MEGVCDHCLSQLLKARNSKILVIWASIFFSFNKMKIPIGHSNRCYNLFEMATSFKSILKGRLINILRTSERICHYRKTLFAIDANVNKYRFDVKIISNENALTEIPHNQS